MKNICFIVYDIEYVGGIEIITKRLSYELRKYYNIFIYSFSNPKTFIEDNIFYTGSEYTNLNERINRISKFIKKNAISTVFIQGRPDALIFLSKLKCPGTKFYACAHSSLTMYSYNKHAMFHQFLQFIFCKKIVVLNEDNKNLYKHHFHFQKKLIIIPNFMENIPEDIEYNINSKKIIIVSRLSREKGIEKIFDVFVPIFKLFPDWKLDIYGDGDLKEDLLNKIKVYKMCKNIKLMGNSKNLATIYPNYSFLVLLSEIEGQPLSLLEGLSFKLPLISFDILCGPKDIIRNDFNGFLIKPFNIESYIEKILTLISSPKLRKLFSDNSKVIMTRFDKKNILEMWKQLIDD